MEDSRDSLEKRLDFAIREQNEVWKSECNLTGTLLEKTFDNFDSQLQPEAFKYLTHWNFGKSCILTSGKIYGIGKTHLVAALVNKLITGKRSAIIVGEVSKGVYKVRCQVYITTETALLARIRATFDNDKTESEESVYKKLSRYALLIIDDVGKVRPRDYSFLQGIYFRIIDERYNLKQDIIITTNLAGKDLENHIGGACSDRLIEMCGHDGIIKMSGESYRRK